MIRGLSKILPRRALYSVTEGLFTSKLLFGFPVKGACWQPSKYRACQLNKLSMTKNDYLVIQKIQNQVMWVLTGDHARDKSTVELLRETGFLSVHQLSSLSSLRLMERTVRTQKPSWFATQLNPLPMTRRGEGGYRALPARINLREVSLIPKAICLWNATPQELRNLPPDRWKSALKSWVRDKVPAKP